jgi:glucose/arabinose dehydrogenase
MIMSLTEDAHAVQTRAPTAPKSNVVVETIVKGLSNPWALQFLPDGRMLITERPGTLRIATRDGKLSQPLAGVPKVAATGQGGLLDIALAPDFATSNLVFFTFAEPRPDSGNGTSVGCGKLVVDGDGGRLEDTRVIFRQEPAGTGGLHFGSRLAFARDGTLFVTMGERYQRDFAQDLTRHWGKVMHITTDGAPAPGNPFLTHATARKEIWSYGHRNPQSAAIHPTTGKLWIVEHGARGGDEVNIPLAGRNYGWPVITYGRDYDGRKIGIGTAKEGMEQPIYYWDPSIAPSGMAFYTADLIPAWKGNLFVGALAGTALHRLVLDGEQIVAEEVLLKDQRERIRDVRQGPDGAIWLLTDNLDGRVLRVTAK